MKTSKTLASLLILASLATVAVAKGPGQNAGGGMGSGAAACTGACAGAVTPGAAVPRTGAGDQTRTQVRDPAANPTGTPLKTRDRIHTPAPVTAPTAPALVPAN